MTFDFVHMAAAAAILLADIFIAQKLGWIERGERKFSWKLFVLIFVSIFLLNLVWPYGSGV